MRLIPAHAGKTMEIITSKPVTGAHPRSRGENHVAATPRAEGTGSSPLTRGKLDRGGADLGSHRLIPAHAGKTFCSASLIRLNAAHPRSRGENGFRSST